MRKTRSVSEAAGSYLKGLMQALPGERNMERMEEIVPDSDHQQLQHMLTVSKWDHRAVLDQVSQEANQRLGGTPDSCLLIDESSMVKKGNHSVGVARQWCGRLGKTDNCQVAVYAALGQHHLSTLVDVRLYLPKGWTEDEARCEDAGIPTDERSLKSKVELGLEIVAHQRALGVQFAWVGADGGYGKDPAFLRGLEAMNETFMVDIHRDQGFYLEDPAPAVPENTNQRGRRATRLKAQCERQRVDKWVEQLPASQWKKIFIRDTTKGELTVDIYHKRIWLWDGNEPSAHQWHLIARREGTKLKYSLSNSVAETPVDTLALMQAQRFWVERSFQDAKSECGMADYQVRKWSAWHHHMALVMMASLFMLEERQLHKETYPLLSCSDIETLLRHFLPSRNLSDDVVIRQMERRHRLREASARSAHQGLSSDCSSG